MKAVKLMMLMGLGALVSACSGADTATRNAPYQPTPVAAVEPLYTVAPAPQAAPMMRVEAINVTVPQKLTVSEANRYYPGGDIVWREDPIGDRHAQVKAIFEDGLSRGAASLDGSAPVIVDVRVTRFHALTEKARYTVGGVHSIEFDMQVRDAISGEILAQPRHVVADLDGFGGQQAIEAEKRGLTQKVRITHHLAEVLRQEMTRPEGFINPKLGLIQAINQL